MTTGEISMLIAGISLGTNGLLVVQFVLQARDERRERKALEAAAQRAEAAESARGDA
ncbi:hypothetical protein [Streptomyces synnematoformans]|uniref:Uncharacterized protein n=1 Tax=Streptomyces synnematoformans TaxID=415721 RepID=A0ABN2XCS2_9ACTN